MTTDTEAAWHVDVEAGLWAVALVVLLALILLTAFRLGRTKEDPVPCCAPGSLGAHPLEDPDPAGVRRCSCGAITSIPGGATATVGGALWTVAPEHVGTPVEVRRLALVPRTDTREHRWPTGELDVAPRAAAVRARHPSAAVPLEHLDTDALPLPHVVWPPS